MQSYWKQLSNLVGFDVQPRDDDGVSEVHLDVSVVGVRVRRQFEFEGAFIPEGNVSFVLLF